MSTILGKGHIYIKDLRSHSTSLDLAAELDIESSSRKLGHSNTKTTLSHYRRVDKEKEKQEALKIDFYIKKLRELRESKMDGLKDGQI